MAHPANALATAGPASMQLYRDLLEAIKTLGPFKEEIKKTSIHLVRASAFAGVRHRKEHLIITMKSTKPIKSKRIIKSQQASKSRWYLDLKIGAKSEVDAELMGWLRDSYAMSD